MRTPNRRSVTVAPSVSSDALAGVPPVPLRCPPKEPTCHGRASGRGVVSRPAGFRRVYSGAKAATYLVPYLIPRADGDHYPARRSRRRRVRSLAAHGRLQSHPSTRTPNRAVHRPGSRCGVASASIHGARSTRRVLRRRSPPRPPEALTSRPCPTALSHREQLCGLGNGLDMTTAATTIEHLQRRLGLSRTPAQRLWPR